MTTPRIIHINTARTWRGGEQQVLYLTIALKKLGIEQIVVVRKKSALAERCRDAGVSVRELSLAGELDFLSAARIAHLARENGYNVVHAHTAKAHAIAVLAKLFEPSLKLLISRRVDFPIKGNLLSRMKYKSSKVDRFLAISENVRQILIRDGIPENKIRIAYSGIDPERFSELPDPATLQAEFSLETEEIIVGNIAALADHKDQKTLIRAIHMLDQEEGLPPFRLFIVGDGELREELHSLAKQFDLLDRRILFPGFRKDIPLFFALFDVFVMSSKEEGLGTSVLDAMASGLPVVATAGGGIPEMVDQEKGGLLCEIGNPEELAKNLKRVILDEDLRKKFGKYNKQRVEDFNYQTTARKTLEVYQELLG